jgi:hypothetical protein
MALGESPSGERALMMLAVNQPLSGDVLDRLRAESGILRVHPISEL